MSRDVDEAAEKHAHDTAPSSGPHGPAGRRKTPCWAPRSQLAGAQRFANGALEGAFEGEEMSRGELSVGYRTFVPLANFLPFTALFSHLVEDRPTR